MVVELVELVSNQDLSWYTAWLLYTKVWWQRFLWYPQNPYESVSINVPSAWQWANKPWDLEFPLAPIFSTDSCELEGSNLEISWWQIREWSSHLQLAGVLLFICFLYLIFFSQTKIFFHRTSPKFSSFYSINHLWSLCRVSLGHGKVLCFLCAHWQGPLITSTVRESVCL